MINGKEKEVANTLKELVLKSCSGVKDESKCFASYQCTWNSRSNKCENEPCAFITDRKTCEGSKNECIFFGGGDKSHNPMSESSTGVQGSDGKELKVGGAGCFASPCRLARQKTKHLSLEKRAKACEEAGKGMTDHSRAYSCLFKRNEAEEQSFLSAKNIC